jgi:hypothetical protein
MLIERGRHGTKKETTTRLALCAEFVGKWQGLQGRQLEMGMIENRGNRCGMGDSFSPGPVK